MRKFDRYWFRRIDGGWRCSAWIDACRSALRGEDDRTVELYLHREGAIFREEPQFFSYYGPRINVGYDYGKAETQAEL